jgi:tetratricopeptide (TPR) repeat protein
MSFRDLFVISRGTKTVLGITLSVVLITVLFAFFYYRRINLSEDPRVEKARRLMSEYDLQTGGADSYLSFPLLDSALAVYRSFPDYEHSFETGVICNNRCSGLLLMALYDSTLNSENKAALLQLSMDYCDSSISVYRKWISEWGDMSEEAIAVKMKPYMNENDAIFEGRSIRKILERRVKNIAQAQTETPRRLSVSYTNKATIYRHMLKQDSALSYYEKALSLWKDNRTARSNMSVLMGGEPLEPKLIEALFPPDKTKK